MGLSTGDFVGKGDGSFDGAEPSVERLDGMFVARTDGICVSEISTGKTEGICDSEISAGTKEGICDSEIEADRERLGAFEARAEGIAEDATTDGCAVDVGQDDMVGQGDMDGNGDAVGSKEQSVSAENT